MNVTSELVKKIQSTTNSEMGNSANSTELRKSMNDIMGKLEQKENVIIKKKIKKSDILNNLSKKNTKNG